MRTRRLGKLLFIFCLVLGAFAEAGYCGNFYTNITVVGPTRDAVLTALTALKCAAYLSPTVQSYTTIYPVSTEEQDAELLRSLAETISKELKCLAIAVMNHDDDILIYFLVDSGQLSDQYNSAPGYFAGLLGPKCGGDHIKLAKAFNAAGKTEQLKKILKGSYTFESDRHAALVGILGLPSCSVGSGYTYIERGEIPEGLKKGDIVFIH